MVIKSIVFTPPLANTALVLLETALKDESVRVKSPKSLAFPVVEIVINSIELTSAGETRPPPITPRVGDAEQATPLLLSPPRLPKSVASPNVAIVTKSISSFLLGSEPPAHIPLV